MNHQKQKKQNNINGDNENVKRNPLCDLPELLEMLTENLVDESVPTNWDVPANLSRESPRVIGSRLG